MKFFTKKSVVQKIILALVIVILVNFTVPQMSYAGWGDIGGKILREVVQLIGSLRRRCNGSIK